METVVLNPLILAQGSYGATIRRPGLRLAGVVIGGLRATLTVIALMANTGDVTSWMIAFFATLLPSAYVALGTPRFSYFGIPVTATAPSTVFVGGAEESGSVCICGFFRARRHLAGSGVPTAVSHVIAVGVHRRWRRGAVSNRGFPPQLRATNDSIALAISPGTSTIGKCDVASNLRTLNQGWLAANASCAARNDASVGCA